MQGLIGERVIDILSQVGKSTRPADPLLADTLLGPIAKATQLERVLSYIAIGQSEGARLRLGGERINQNSGGGFVGPARFDALAHPTPPPPPDNFLPLLPP